MTTMRTALLTTTTLALAFGVACSSASSYPEEVSVDRPLAETFAAHGGLEAWRSQASLTYRMVGFPLTEQVAAPSVSRVDLRSRRNRIDADGYRLGFDGETAWVAPGTEAVGLPPRFYALGSFYFIGMPFVFADEGAVVRDAGRADVAGESLRQFHVGFADGVGHSDEDHYVALVDPDSHRLRWIHHTVTETNGDSGARVAWRFDAWQRVGGVDLPAKMTFFSWQNGQPQGDGAPFTIDRMAISTRPFDDAIYRRID